MPASIRAVGALLICFAVADAAAQAPVRVQTAEMRSIVQRVNVSGTVTSPRDALLSTAVAGLVAELAVDEGHRVRAGEPLLKLDAELAELALERARAEVRQHETALDDARRRFSEAEKVGPEKGIARTQIESLRAEVASDEAALAAARVAAAEQRALVDRHTLVAPFDGVISQRFTELGEWVNPGDGLVELVATANLRFDFRVAQNYYRELTPDAPIQITLDALPGGSLNGRIDSIVPVKNPGGRTFLVRALADAVDGADLLSITPGMSAHGRLSLATGRTGITVPRDAILRFPDGRVTVWRIELRDEVPVAREQLVETGFEFDGQVEIRSGLNEGDSVVVRGNETLQDGQTVKILDGDS